MRIWNGPRVDDGIRLVLRPEDFERYDVTLVGDPLWIEVVDQDWKTVEWHARPNSHFRVTPKEDVRDEAQARPPLG